MDEPKFVVFRNGQGAVFVAWLFDGGEDIKIGLSFCNPKDLPNTYKSREEWRERGEEIALGRLKKKPVTVKIAQLDEKVTIRADELEKMVARAVKDVLFQMAPINIEKNVVEVPAPEFCRPERFGLREYDSYDRGEFQIWMSRFMERMRQQERWLRNKQIDRQKAEQRNERV